MIKRSFYIFLGLLVFLTACSNDGYTDVSIEEAKELIDKQEVTVLDVRTPDEFQGGHIPDALLIPLQELESRINELDKENTYLVVCRSGSRSIQASEILNKNGFSNINNMTGGMNSWTYEIKK